MRRSGTPFSTSLSDERNRQTESWVQDALRNLHHPSRLAQSEKYLLPSLELLQEIQVTGDIFFPSQLAAGEPRQLITRADRGRHRAPVPGQQARLQPAAADENPAGGGPAVQGGSDKQGQRVTAR